MTSWYQCDALTNWAIKPQMLGAGQSCVHMFLWKRWIWNKSYKICRNESRWRMILAVENAIYAIVKEAWKKFRTSMGFEPVNAQYWCNALINWAMKPLMLEAGQLCVHSYVPVKEMNVTDVYEINHISTAEMKSSEEWSLHLWTQFMQLRKKPEKNNQNFNRVWAYDLTMPMWCYRYDCYFHFGGWLQT